MAVRNANEDQKCSPTVLAEVDQVIIDIIIIITPFIADQLWERRIQYFIPDRANKGEVIGGAEPGQSLTRMIDNEPKVARLKEHRQISISLVRFTRVEGDRRVAIIVFHVLARFRN